MIRQLQHARHNRMIPADNAVPHRDYHAM